MNLPCTRSPAGRLACLCALAFSGAGSFAQTPAPAGTLEVPTLVVDHEHRPVSDLRSDQFRVRIDDRDELTPLAVHVQQNEPLTLSILIDASQDPYHDLAQIGDDLAKIKDMFLPSDRLTVYALDCTMARALYNEEPTPEGLRKAVAAALNYPKLHDHNASPNCGKSVHLWDNVAAAIATLSKLPGRRVLLLATSGHDGGSKYDWQTVHTYARNQNVALFGLQDQRQVDADTFIPSALSVQNGHTFKVISPTPETRKAVPFELLCANSGGLILNALPLHRDETIAYLLFIIRHRLILTIPADAYASGASHTLKVTVPHSPYFVSAAGAGDPQPKP